MEALLKRGEKLKKQRRKRKIFGFSNRKGSAIIDTAMIIVVMFVFAIISIYGMKIFDEIRPDILADVQDEPSANQTIENLHSRYPTTMDGAFIFAFVLIWCLIIVASFMIDTHPIFFVFTLALLAFIIISGALLSNAYGEITEDSELSTIATEFPMSNYIMNHLLIFTVAIGFSVAIAIFGKYKLTRGAI